MNLSVIQSKGGVTKSTIAANLAAWLVGKGHGVGTLDLDGGDRGNRTLASILESTGILVYEPQTIPEFRQRLLALAERFHFTVVDAPSGFQRTAEMNIELLKHTDFAIVPVTPNFGDIEPLFVVQEIIEEARRDNPFLEARVLINCVDRRTTEGRNLKTTMADIREFAPKLPVMKHTIGVDTAAFKTASKKHMAVVDGPRSTGRHDLEAAFSELLSDMVVSINKQSVTARNAVTASTQEDRHVKRLGNG